MMTKKHLLMIEWVVGLAGFIILLVFAGWKIWLGVVLIMWSNNLFIKRRYYDDATA